jgi:hypothetical protein
MTVVTSDPSVILGVTHMLVNGVLRRLLKCSFCSFQNIHEDTIIHHIKFTDDAQHNAADIEQRDKSQYVVTKVTKKSPYGSYLSKAELNVPWIRCLFCNYRDKIAFDLSLHILEVHKQKLLQVPISAKYRTETNQIKEPYARYFSKFEGSMEFRLDIAIEMAKEENRNAGVKHAVRLVQNRHLRNQALQKKKSAT